MPVPAGPWIQTYTGGKFFYDDLDSSDIRIEDIAHSLAMTCRFSGHCTRFYSVAQHSVNVAKYMFATGCSNDQILGGLLHDAGETYLPDYPSSAKTPQQTIEEREVLHYIFKSLGLLVTFTIIQSDYAPIHHADRVMLGTERNHLMVKTDDNWGTPPTLLNPSEYGVEIEYWCPEKAEYMFLKHYNELRSIV